MARFKPYLFKRALKKYRFLIFILFLLIIVWFLFYWKLKDNNKKIEANIINNILEINNFNNCKKILKLNKNILSINKYINKEKYIKVKTNCLNTYNISNISYTKDICSLIVNTTNKTELNKYFLKLDGYEKVKNKCISKYLNLKFLEDKWVYKKVLIEIKYPKQLRYNDQFELNFTIFNNSNLDKKISIIYSSKQLGIINKKISLDIDKKSLKNYKLKLKNIIKRWILDLKIWFYDKQKFLESDNLVINILNSPNIWFRVYKYWKTTNKNLFVDSNFSINKDINTKKSFINIEFYNNSLVKLKDIYNSLNRFKVTTSLYDISLIQSINNLEKLSDNDLAKIWFNRDNLLKQKKILINDLINYRLESWMFSLRKNTQVADFIVSSYIYDILNKSDIKLYDLKNTKQNLYYYINDKSVQLWDRLNVMMILSFYDKNLDLRFINNSDVLLRHDLITYTYALFNEWPIINNDLVKININKIKNLLNIDEKNTWFYNKYTDKLLFLNFLLDYHYYDNQYILNLFDDIYKKDFDKINISYFDKSLALSALQKKYIKFENNDKTKYWFMIWLARNTTKVFWLGWMLKSYEGFYYNLADLLTLWDKKVYFRTKKLLWKNLKVNLVLNWKYNNIWDNIKNNKNIAIYREVYQKDKNWKYILFTGKNYVLWKEYKIIDKIRFKDKRPRKNIIIKDFLPSTFEFISILWEDNKYNSFSIYNNSLEFQYANYWGQDINISYLVKPKYIWRFLDPGIRVFMMFNDNVYWESKENMINVK